MFCDFLYIVPYNVPVFLSTEGDQPFKLLSGWLQVLDSEKYTPADQFLPESYTCFFLLKIPRYTSQTVLCEKLKYAIYFCKAIDMDDYARVNLTDELDD